MRILLFLMILFVGTSGLKVSAQSLIINEIMASNSSTIADPTGDYADWIELYNPSAVQVDLSGYFISDNSAQPTKFQLPSGLVINPNSHLILWASSDPSRGVSQLGFSLSASGEFVGLYKPDGVTVIDSISFGRQFTDVAWGRQSDGAGNWYFLNPATPGATNNISTAYSGVLEPPLFSQQAGFYSGNLALSISSSEPGVTIYYTLDGSEPDPSAMGGSTFFYKNQYRQVASQSDGPLLTSSYKTFLYTSPLTVVDRSPLPDYLAKHSSTYDNSPDYLPSSPLFKGTVVRAQAVKAGYLASSIKTQTFLITPAGSARFSMPVVSVATPPNDLFDYTTGMYTAGQIFDQWRAGNSTSAWGPGFPGNFKEKGDQWESEGNVEFFDAANTSVVVNQPIDIRLHGGFTRGLPQKTLRLYSRSSFSWPFFPGESITSFERLLLRNSGNDWGATMFKDGMYQQAVKHLRFDTQAYRPSIVLLNGEYWGIHNLRERYDKYYLRDHYQVPADSVDLIENNYEVNEGDIVAYNQLIDLLNVGVQGQNYETVKTRMDVDNFMDYQIAEIYISNTDWVENNIRCWRKKVDQYQPDAPYGHDGRWRWMMYDTDWGMLSGPAHNGLAFATNNDPNAYPSPVRTFILRRLLENQEFRNQFINRYADLLNTTFLPGRMLNFIDLSKQSLTPEMPEHINRWKKPTSLNQWDEHIQVLVDFVQQRPVYARQHIQSKFGLTAQHTLLVDVSSVQQGSVQVNTVNIVPSTPGVAPNPYPWAGTYFEGVPVTLTARPLPGYKFSRWRDGATGLGTDATLILNLTGARSIVAEFELDNEVQYEPVAYNLDSCGYTFSSWPAEADSTQHPASMRFVYMDTQDPPLGAGIAGFTNGRFNYASRSRVNGLGSDGVSFINTTSGDPANVNPGYPMGAVGGALLGINTLNQAQVEVAWRGGTVEPNNRTYAIRLQYRVGDSGTFQDVLDGSGQPIEYVRNTAAGHSQVMGPVALPAEALGKPYVQLFWRYYYVSGSGSRARLRLDDIVVSRAPCKSVQNGNWHTASTWSCGRVPSACDPVVIQNGHQVDILTSDAEALSLEFMNNGHLNVSSNRNLTLFKIN